MFAAAGLAVGAPVAAAQTDGSGQVISVVPSTLELVLGQPKSTFATFPSAKTYTTSFNVAVTSTNERAQLSIADAEVTTGSKMGRLASGAKLLPAPLEARVGKTAFAPLDTAVEAQLTRWTSIQANDEARVDLRQKVEKKTSGSYRKVLLVTLSTDTP
jgi:hypothetical protein